VGLYCKRNEGESWLDAVKRIAGKYGMEEDCVAAYCECIEAGESEELAAWNALYEWDCLDYRDDA